jgi:hypothetical protein
MLANISNTTDEENYDDDDLTEGSSQTREHFHAVSRHY